MTMVASSILSWQWWYLSIMFGNGDQLLWSICLDCGKSLSIMDHCRYLKITFVRTNYGLSAPAFTNSCTNYFILNCTPVTDLCEIMWRDLWCHLMLYHTIIELLDMCWQCNSCNISVFCCHSIYHHDGQLYFDTSVRIILSQG